MQPVKGRQQQYDMVGRRFNSWTVLAKAKGGKYLCECDCGTKAAVGGFNLREHISRRCMDCHQRELTGRREPIERLMPLRHYVPAWSSEPIAARASR